MIISIADREVYDALTEEYIVEKIRDDFGNMDLDITHLYS